MQPYEPTTQLGALTDQAHQTLLEKLCGVLTRRALTHVAELYGVKSARDAAFLEMQRMNESAQVNFSTLLASYGFPPIRLPEPYIPPTDTPVLAITSSPAPLTLDTALDHIAERYAQHSKSAFVRRYIQTLDAKSRQIAAETNHITLVTQLLKLHAVVPELVESIALLYRAVPARPEFSFILALQHLRNGKAQTSLDLKDLSNGTQVIPHASVCRFFLEHHTNQPGFSTLVAALGWLTIVEFPDCDMHDISLFITALDELKFDDTSAPDLQILPKQRSLHDTFALPMPPCMLYKGYDAVQNAQHTYATSQQHFAVTAKYIPKTSKSEQNLQGEDTLLFATSSDAAIAIVTDGVSQSVYGYHAAQQLTIALWRIWQRLPHHPKTSQAYWDSVLIPALALASIITESLVRDAMDGQQGFLQSVLQEGYEQTGSQAIFAVVIITEAHIACLWMGNTRIMIGNALPLVTVDSIHRTCTANHYFSPQDDDFLDDKHRFSSQKRVTLLHRGMRNTAFVHLVDTTQLPQYRVIIHSDALEPYAAQLAVNELSKPLPITFMNMRESAKRDDATLLDIVVSPLQSASEGSDDRS